MTTRQPFDSAQDKTPGVRDFKNHLDIWAYRRPVRSPAASGTYREALGRAREMLAEHNIEDPQLEAVVLLTHALQISRVQVYLEFDVKLNPEQSGQFWGLIERRLKGEPTAYITGRREFYKLDFCVDSSVLIPRPETELLVEKSLDIARGKTLELAKRSALYAIADIGTGCGAIAISLAVKLPQVRVYATDISTAALKVAGINCQKHNVADRVCLLEGDLLAPLSEPVDLIIANLPYVRQAELKDVNTFGFEPTLALDGGPDGLDQVRRLCSQLAQQADKLRPGGSLLLEIGQGQRQAVTALLRSLFPSARVEAFTDLAGVGRVVVMRL